MKKKWVIVLVLIVLIIIITASVKILLFDNRVETVTIKHFDNSLLMDTVISSHMEQTITDGMNVVYCSTFQISWNELKGFLNGDVELLDGPEMVAYLNKSLSTKEDVSDEDYVAVAGFAEDNIGEEINSQLETKFDNPKFVDFQEYEEDGNQQIIAYAYLYKNLKFLEQFESLERPLDFYVGDDTFEVEAFGIKDYSYKNSKMGEQVDIIDYNNYDDFIIRLNTESSDDEIILAMVSPQNTLLETIEYVSNRVDNGSDESLMENDVLKIPKFAFNITYNYTDLLGCYLKNETFTTFYFDKAVQQIEFVLDEKGVILESEAIVTTTDSIVESRRLVFDQPFLLYMKEKGAQYPYFAMWIENTELMASIDQ